MVDSAQKKTIIDQYIDSGRTTLVVDGTVDGVVLPPYLLFSDHVKLSVSRAVEQKVKVTQKKVTANLSFDGEPFSVTIPMNAIYGVYASVDDMVSFNDCLPASFGKTLNMVQKVLGSKGGEDFADLLDGVIDGIRRAERRRGR